MFSYNFSAPFSFYFVVNVVLAHAHSIIIVLHSSAEIGYNAIVSYATHVTEMFVRVYLSLNVQVVVYENGLRM
jgi:hypothetical protein